MQSNFEFKFGNNINFDDFIIGESNSSAHEHVMQWPEWGDNVLILHGPKACGKTHLCHLWQKKAKALLLTIKDIYEESYGQKLDLFGSFIVEDIDKIHDDLAFLHFFNAMKECNKYVLMTSNVAPSSLSVRLSDLKSRLASVPSVGIGHPGEELVKALLFKQFSDKQLKVSNDVITYLSARIQRTHADIVEVVDFLDRKALIERKNITVPFIKEVLAKQVQSEPVPA